MEDIIERAVTAIIDDLAGRKGLGNKWDDTDAETREEIKKTWCRILREEGL